MQDGVCQKEELWKRRFHRDDGCSRPTWPEPPLSRHLRVRWTRGFGTDSADFSLTFDTDHLSAALPGNPTFGDITRSYTNFREAAMETGMSGRWGGIHWPFDIASGFALGTQVALNALNEFASVESSSFLPLSIGLSGLAVLHPLRNRRRPH